MFIFTQKCFTDSVIHYCAYKHSILISLTSPVPQPEKRVGSI